MLNNFIPLLQSFLPAFSEYFLFPFLALGFLSVVPCMVRSLFSWR